MKHLVLFLGIFSALAARGQQDSDVLTYIRNFRVLAIEEMKRSGVPAAITLAQGIHETQAGKSDLVLRSNNHFGIKCKTSWTGDRVYHDDDRRGECFRSYPAAEDSYRDHSDFLKNSQRYASLFQLDPEDYKSWCYGLKNAGYATNNRYPELLINLIEDYHLQDYTLMALGKLNDNPGDPVFARAETGSKNYGNETGYIKILPVTNSSGPSVPAYPEGEFSINQTRVIFARAGQSLLLIADRYGLPLARLLDFNDLDRNTLVLNTDQLVFLQRKRKKGAVSVHVVGPGENLYIISQQEGIRLESLLTLNGMTPGTEISRGVTLYLQEYAPAKPKTINQGTETGKQPVFPPTEKRTINSPVRPVQETVSGKN